MRFDLPDGLKLVHEMRVPVRWGDLDAMGHVNPGEIVARHYVAAPKPGSKSLDTFFTLSMADTPGVVSANGGATLVWVDFPNKTTVALPDHLRVACS